MKNIFNRYINLLIFSFTISILVSCTNSQTNISSNDYYLDNFKLEQIDNDSNPIFRLTSSKAIIDPYSNNIDASDVIVNLLGKNRLFRNISANNCLIDKINNVILMKGNIKITGFSDPKSYLLAEEIFWDQSTRIINLSGNITLSYLTTRLRAQDGSYNEKENKISFTGLKEYIVFKDNSDNNDILIKLNSDMAVIDNNNKIIEFTSINKRVESFIDLK